ncbi:MAG TPA: hypothetical protein ENI62_09075 [Gammaproteobacteria bacterium]|nr:hypothetical protein [Gammaproteobacteria bacterium]
MQIAQITSANVQQYYPQQSALDSRPRHFATGFQYGRDSQPQREPLVRRPLTPVNLVQRLDNGPNQKAVNSYVDVANYELNNHLRQMVGIDVYT